MTEGEAPSSNDCQYLDDTDVSISSRSRSTSVSGPLDPSKSGLPSTDESSTESAATTVSLLFRLKSPTLADLARKRKVRTSPPKG